MKDNPLRTTPPPSPDEIKAALDSLIMSASGWRKVFAADGRDDSLSERLSPADMFLAAAMGAVFAEFLRARTGRDNKEEGPIIVGMDTRHTGPAIADLIIRSLAARGVPVSFLGVLPAPEIMAFVRSGGGTPNPAKGFVYISASHNPPGHNGVKFGLNGGSVLSAAEMQPLISAYKEFVLCGDFPSTMMREIEACGSHVLAAAYRGVSEAKAKAKAKSAYSQFLKQVITASPDQKTADERVLSFSWKTPTTGPGILADFNGSSRILSADRDILAAFGCSFACIGAEPGTFVHPIIPEGRSLDACRKELERLNRENPRFVLGYVPDCDGDRGNIVYIDGETSQADRRARAMEAQDVFALAAAVECAYHRWLSFGGPDARPLAIVANDPTSLRVDAVAQALGAQVFRAEVGEANVVNCAREFREAGYDVRVLGEGSNGGTIIHPSAVRDPLTTIGALLKVLLPLPRRGGTTVRSILAKAFGLPPETAGEEGIFPLCRLIRALPAYTTTGVDEDRAKLSIKTMDHGVLKARFEDVFLRSWEERKGRLRERFGIFSYEEINYEGTKAKEGFGPAFRSGAQRGGLKIQFHDRENLPAAFIWMRGSGTEPVFRILADVRGSDAAAEEELLSWLKDMIKEADSKA